MESTSKKKKHLQRSEDLDDINLKMEYAKRVYKACEIEMKMTSLGDGIDYINQRMKFYTEAKPYLIYKASKTRSLQIDFKDWITLKQSYLKTPMAYQHTRKRIIDSYINKGEVPAVVSLLDKKVSPKAEKDCMTEMKKKGFTWVRIPGTNKSVIVEKPEVVHKRMRYLLKMRKFREEGKNIIYIEEMNVFRERKHNLSLDARVNSHAPIAIMAANKEGFMSLFFYDLATENVMISFITDIVLPQVTEPSVVVMGDQDHYGENMCRVPDENGLKHELREWLHKNNVAHDPAMHRLDLLTLINRSKRGVDIERTKISHILKDYGHELIRRPLELPMLNFFEKYMSDIRKYEEVLESKQTGQVVVLKRYKCKSEMSKLKKKYRKEDLMKLEKQLVENEQKTYLEDLQMEDIIDRIMTMAKNDAVHKNDLEFVYDSQKLDDEFWSRLVIGS